VKTPYLLQRIGFDSKNNKLVYDYMGSAEFEFGSIPKIYREMAKDSKQFVIKTVVGADGKSIVSANGFGLFYIGRESEYEEVMKFIPDLLAGKTRLKERSELRFQYEDPVDFRGRKYWREDRYGSNTGVLDIDNGYFLVWQAKEAVSVFTYFKTVLVEKFSK